MKSKNRSRSSFFKLTAVALTAAVMAMYVSCKDTEEPVVEAPTLTIDPPDKRDIVFAADGVKATANGEEFTPIYTVTTNQPKWEVEKSEEEWVKISISGKTFTLSADKVTGIVQPKPAKLTIKAGDATPVVINVQQLAAGPSLAVTPLVPEGTSIEFTANGEIAYRNGEVFTPEFTVVTNVGDWDAAVTGGEWLTIDLTDKANNKFSLVAEANTNVEPPEPATVTVSAGEAEKVIFTVTQLPGVVPLIDFALSEESIALKGVGETRKIEVTLDPPTATVTPAEWKSLDEAVVTVDDDGVITAVGEGTTTVTCTINEITKEIEVEVWTTKPFMGPHIISKAEPYYLDSWKFDIGGPGFAYFDTGNSEAGAWAASTVRADDPTYASPYVGIEPTSGPPYNIGGNAPDEWHLFTIEVQDAGDYKIEVDYSCGYSPPGQIHLEVDGVNVTGTFEVFSTGNWANYVTLKIATVTLTAGTHKVKFYVERTGINYRGLIFSEDTGTGPDPDESQPFMGPHILSSGAPYYLEIWKFDTGGNGVGYFETSNANIGAGATLRASDPTYTSPPYVQIEGSEPPYNTGGNQPTEWQLFTVEVQDAGDYSVEVEYSAGWSYEGEPTGGRVSIYVDDVEQISDFQVTHTELWANWNIEEIGTISLTTGKHKIKFYIVFTGINVRGLQFTKL